MVFDPNKIEKHGKDYVEAHLPPTVKPFVDGLPHLLQEPDILSLHKELAASRLAVKGYSALSGVHYSANDELPKDADKTGTQLVLKAKVLERTFHELVESKMTAMQPPIAFDDYNVHLVGAYVCKKLEGTKIDLPHERPFDVTINMYGHRHGLRDEPALAANKPTLSK